MTLKYKYSIGDKVLLVKSPSYENRQYAQFRYSDDMELASPKEYVVNGYGFDETGDGIKIYYRLDAYCDEIIQYHNRITDEYLEPSGECHPFELESDVMSADGHVIKLGDSVFYSLYDRYNGNDGTIPNITFSFTGHGNVVSIHYFEEKNYKPRIEVTYERDFLCTYSVNGKVKEALDARRYGDKHTEHVSQIDYGIRPGYAEAFAEEISKKSNRWYLEHNKYDTEQWLKFLGVYEETMAAIDKWIKKRDGGSKSSAKKKKPKKDEGKLKNILSTLTEEEKKKLKEML
jgi:hypothetical protein